MATSWTITPAAAHAFWQKLRENVPYLLDPTQRPPPALGIGDALIAVFAFFAGQRLIGLLFAASGYTPATSVFWGYALRYGEARTEAGSFAFAKLPAQPPPAREPGLVAYVGCDAARTVPRSMFCKFGSWLLNRPVSVPIGSKRA